MLRVSFNNDLQNLFTISYPWPYGDGGRMGGLIPTFVRGTWLVLILTYTYHIKR